MAPTAVPDHLDYFEDKEPSHCERLTVGRVDSGMAVLVTSESHQLVEMPVALLCQLLRTDTLRQGTVVRMSAERDIGEEAQARVAFERLQTEIAAELGIAPDAHRIGAPGTLRVVSKTHTTMTLRWPPWRELANNASNDPAPSSMRNPTNSTLRDARQPHAVLPARQTLDISDWDADFDRERSLPSTENAVRGSDARTSHNRERSTPARVYAVEAQCNGQRIGSTAIDPEETLLRLTGLDPAKTYTLRIVFRTAAGIFHTNPVTETTPDLGALSCLSVVVMPSGSTIQSGPQQTHAESSLPERLAAVVDDLKELGATVTEAFDVDKTTHVVIVPGGEAAPGTAEVLRQCKENSIPVLDSSWVQACQRFGRMQSVSRFYMDGEDRSQP